MSKPPLESVAALGNLAVALAAAGLAVSDQPWAETLLIGAVGGLYLISPPQARFPRFLPILLVLLLLLAGSAFLPAAWFGSSFRIQFIQRGIVLPWTFSPQPWLTLEDLTLLLASLCWAWSCFESKLSLGQRDFLTGAYLVGLAILAAAFIVAGTSPGPNLPVFLQGVLRFENRNQTGDILAMGGILSLFRGVTVMARRRGEGMLWLLLSLVFLTAIFRNGSRAAVGLFVLGGLIVFFLMSRERRLNKAVVLALCGLGVVGASVFLVEGGDLRRRFLNLLAGNDARWEIYRDALRMVVTGPWQGVGLGNFEGVFNVERTQNGASMSRCIHPESDWLWIAAELGPGGALLFALGIVLIFRHWLRATPFPQLTRAGVIIAVVFLVHTLIDVGGHRLGAVWNCLYLAGLGAFRNPARRDVRLPGLAMRGVGVLLLVIAGLRMESMSSHPWMPIRASLVRLKKDFVAVHDVAEKIRLLNQAVVWAPLDWLSYYQRGLILMNNDPDVSTGGDADFNRALYLEQNSIDLPFAIGEVCRDNDRAEAMVAWREALRRGSSRREELFEDRFTGLTLSELLDLAEGNPNLEVIAISHQGGPDFDPARRKFLEENPDLEGVDAACGRKLFARWLEAGDNDELIGQWPIHPAWREAGWRAYAGALAKAGRYDDAVHAVFQQMPAPVNPTDSASYLQARQSMASGQSQAAWHLLAPLLEEPAAAGPR